MKTQKTVGSKEEVRIIALGISFILLIGVYFIGQYIWRSYQQNEASYNALAGSGTATEDYPTISAESLQKMIRTPGEKFILIDIRSAEAYNLSHIPNAVSYPGETLLSTNFSVSDKIIVIGDETDTALNNRIAGFLHEKNTPYAFVKNGQTAWDALHEQTVTTGDPQSIADQSKVRYISPKDLKSRLSAGEKFFILDTQDKDRFAKKHLQGAVNIPLSELEHRIKEVPSGSKIVAYGNNNLASFQTGITLFDMNIFSAIILTGENIFDPASGLFIESK
jgi:rhodanese-related sulfurtransferase